MTVAVRKHIETLSDDELQEILRRDYLRRLIRYKKTDELMRQKYGMTYEEFIKRNVVAEQNFSWEAESDSQDWEMALDGIRTMKSKLSEIDGKA
ncbi:MAG: hypothetical protein ONB44_21035 [candidate division KSB1 bacterium]|nr:hypothetical protein [candidate division KSB1 bacterium]MDZ7304619.1 hypothetical protein [candidate division KSB1 bacterium]MDZ7313752.1 hypothetical protein [candidate division KSB1 bacterium]